MISRRKKSTPNENDASFGQRAHTQHKNGYEIIEAIRV
jgi:hypothetical protein